MGDRLYEGPFEVTEVLDHNNYAIMQRGQRLERHADRLRRWLQPLPLQAQLAGLVERPVGDDQPWWRRAAAFLLRGVAERERGAWGLLLRNTNGGRAFCGQVRPAYRWWVALADAQGWDVNELEQHMGHERVRAARRLTLRRLQQMVTFRTDAAERERLRALWR